MNRQPSISRVSFAIIVILIALLSAGNVTATVQDRLVSSVPIVPDQALVAQALSNSPIMFIENVGQFADGARFQVRGGNDTLWLAEDALWITLFERLADDGARSRDFTDTLKRLDSERVGAERDNVQRKAVNLKLSFPGAAAHSRLEPFDRLDTIVSYFFGDDPARWRPDVPVWGGVRYVDLYPGIDLEITGRNGQIVQRLVARALVPLDGIG